MNRFINQVAGFTLLLSLFLSGAGTACAEVSTTTRYIDHSPPKRPPLPAGPILDTDGLLYRVTLTRNGDPGDRHVLTGTWAGLTDNARQHPEAHVSVTISTNGAHTSWGISVLPEAGYGVWEVEYPLLVAKPISGPAYDRLVVPHQSGQIIRDPFNTPERDQGAPHRFGKYIWYGSYGSKFQAMQYVLYENGHDGVMIWTQDGAGYIKDFEVSKAVDPSYPGEGLRISVHHYPNAMGKEGAAWENPYPVVVSRYENGWQEAAKIYRAWAVEQPWCADGGLLARVRSGALPPWYAQNAMWLMALDHQQYDMIVRLSGLFPDVEFSVFYSQWQRWPFDEANPDYFPPRDEASHRAYLALQQTHRIHLFPYKNMQLMDVTWDHSLHNAALLPLTNAFAVPPPVPLLDAATVAAVPHYARYEEYWGTDQERTADIRKQVREAWKGPVRQALLEKIESDWFTAYPYEQKAFARQLAGAWGKDESVIDTLRVKRRFKPFCRADRLWQDAFKAMALKTLKEYGADGQYFDQSCLGSVWACWSDRHGHPPGLGTTYLTGTRDLIQGVRNAAPGKVFYGECAFEYYIGVLEDGHTQFPDYFRHEVVPFWSAVYQGYFAYTAWSVWPGAFENMSDLTAQLAAMLHTGQKIGFSSTLPWLELLNPRHKDLGLAWLQRASRILLDTMDTFVYGERLRDPEVKDSPWHNMRYHADRTGSRVLDIPRPVVEASCWRSFDGKKHMILMTHSGDKEIRVRLRSPELRAGAVFHEVQGDGRFVYADDVAVSLQPFTITAFVSTTREE